MWSLQWLGWSPLLWVTQGFLLGWAKHLSWDSSLALSAFLDRSQSYTNFLKPVFTHWVWAREVLFIIRVKNLLAEANLWKLRVKSDSASLLIFRNSLSAEVDIFIKLLGLLEFHVLFEIDHFRIPQHSWSQLLVHLRVLHQLSLAMVLLSTPSWLLRQTQPVVPEHALSLIFDYRLQLLSTLSEYGWVKHLFVFWVSNNSANDDCIVTASLNFKVLSILWVKRILPCIWVA